LIFVFCKGTNGDRSITLTKPDISMQTLEIFKRIITGRTRACSTTFRLKKLLRHKQ
jgi:hypothetical protein